MQTFSSICAYNLASSSSLAEEVYLGAAPSVLGPLPVDGARLNVLPDNMLIKEWLGDMPEAWTMAASPPPRFAIADKSAEGCCCSSTETFSPCRHLTSSAAMAAKEFFSLMFLSRSRSYRRFHSSAVSSSFTQTTFLIVFVLKRFYGTQWKIWNNENDYFGNFYASFRPYSCSPLRWRNSTSPQNWENLIYWTQMNWQLNFLWKLKNWPVHYWSNLCIYLMLRWYLLHLNLPLFANSWEITKTYLCPKSRVDLVSLSLKLAGDTQMTIVVLEFPPSDSCRIRVSFESL